MVQAVTGKPDLLLSGHASASPKPAGRGSSRTAGDGSVEATTKPVERADLERAATRVREAAQKANAHLQIEIDPDLNRVVVKILKGESGEVIRQIPPQEFLDLAKELDRLKGLLLDEHV